MNEELARFCPLTISLRWVILPILSREADWAMLILTQKCYTSIAIGTYNKINITILHLGIVSSTNDLKRAFVCHVIVIFRSLSV